MSTTSPIERSNNSFDEDCHVEMTNELETEHDNTGSEAVTYEETISEKDTTIVRTPVKSQETQSCFSDEETLPNSPWGSVTDHGDAGSTSSNSSWGTAIYTDMRYTMVSNAFFLVGACVQSYTAFIDLRDAKEERDDYDDDDYDDDDDDDYVYTVADKAYYALYSVGPLLYIINSIIDVRWLREHSGSPWSWSFWCRCVRHNNSLSSVEIPNTEQQEQYRCIVEVDINDTEETSNFDDAGSYSTMGDSVGTAYRSELFWQLVAALLFGLGATFEFYSTFLDDYWGDEDDSDDDAYLIKMENKRNWYVSNYKIEFIGMHLYLFSGIIQLISQRNSYRSGGKLCFGSQDDKESDDTPDSTNPIDSSNRLAELLMFLGTALFVFGTLMDCGIAYLSDPSIRLGMDPSKTIFWDLNQFTLSICNLISSMLWNVDALFYIWADILLYSLHKKGSKGRKWLCKKRLNCICTGEDNETALRDDNHLKPLLRGHSITSYSSL